MPNAIQSDEANQEMAKKEYEKLVAEHGLEHLLSKKGSLKSNIKAQFKQINQKLDKFYTKESVAQNCLETLLKVLEPQMDLEKEVLLVEPSAGSGVFLKQNRLPMIGFDIMPSSEKIIKANFLTENIRDHLTKKDAQKKLIFLGNPPFGKRSWRAIRFINKAFEYGDVVAFILPIQFRKWSAQSKINDQAALIFDESLHPDSFEFLGEEYSVRCCFQIWAKGDTAIPFKNLRIKTKPQTSHPDFEMHQFNRTDAAKKFFDYPWDFAVVRQGHADYKFKAYNKSECDPKKQWIFFKAKDKKVLKNLLNIDFESLSKKNISTPGFGKADVIECYSKLA